MAAVWHWREETAGELVQAAREHLAAGRLLALPTDTFYGLAADPFQEEALARLYRLKGRTPDKPVLLLVSGPEMVRQAAKAIPAGAHDLMARFWPGPLTLIFPARPGLSARLTGGAGGGGPASTPPGTDLPPHCRAGISSDRHQRQPGR
jgi:L-threonylcarbamoyladenylate synthase